MIVSMQRELNLLFGVYDSYLENVNMSVQNHQNISNFIILQTE